MEFRKASAQQKMQEARGRNPGLFDRITAKAVIGQSTACWPYTGVRHPDGYGLIKSRSESVRVHRAMFALFFPDVPAPVVRHKCNNPSCVNPAHLRAGTPKDNAIDRMLAGRGGDLRGENNGRAKLTAEQVREIRASNLSGADLGRKYGVSKVMACRIRAGKAWTHI